MPDFFLPPPALATFSVRRLKLALLLTAAFLFFPRLTWQKEGRFLIVLDFSLESRLTLGAFTEVCAYPFTT